MINVSNAFKAELNNDNRSFLPYLDIVLADGTVLETLDSSDIWDGGFKIDDGVTASGEFTIGSCITNKLTITLNNIYDKFSTYDFYMAKVTAYLGLELPDGTIEKIPKGEFTVDEPKYNGAVNILECLDNMYKLDSPYERVKTSYPATVGEIVRDICVACEVVLLTTVFEGSDIVINERPDDTGLSCRQVLSYAMQRICKFARCDTYGRLVVGWFDQQVFETGASLDGGSFDADTPYSTGDTADGGFFAPWNTGDVVDAGTFADQKRFHHLFSISSLNVSTDDVVITGVKVTEENNNIEIQEQAAYLYGKEGYVLAIAGNPFIGAGQAEEVATYIGKKLVGLRFRPMEGAFLEDPTLEAGDLLYVTDEKQNTYKCLATNLTFTLGNYMQVSCDAETPRKNSSYQYSELTKAMVKIRKQTKQQLSTYDKTVQNMTSLISKGFGMYLTPEEQEDGSVIWYMHDKPTVEESSYVLTNTSNGLMSSLDGGTTWAVDKNGNALYNVLTVIGLNANWINAGALVVKDKNKNVIFSADMDKKSVFLNGEYVQIGGKPLEDAIGDGVTEAENYSDSKLADYANAVTKDMNSLQAQIDGQIESYYEDYEPSLQNLPASEWTTTAEREKHIGDLFYWKSTGYSYRFLLDGATWKWQLVQDTDITKALATAEQAQDTADGKRRVFVSQPVPPYDIGDLWMQGSSGDILTCSTARASGSSYVSTDWAKLNKYTDDTKADQAAVNAQKALNKFTQEIIFNTLTNNGEVQGVYLSNNKIYINASYIKSGTLTGDLINAKGMNVTDTDGNMTLEITESGKVKLNVSEFNLSGKSIEEIFKTESNLLNENFVYSGTLVKGQSDPDGGTNAVKLTATGTDSFYSANASTNKPIKSTGQAYTFSVWLKASKATTIKISLNHTNGVLQDVDLTTSWKRYSISTMVETITTANQVTIGGWGSFSTDDGADIYIYDPIVVYGMDTLSQQLTQEEVFNALTNNGEIQGIYMQNGNLFIDATYIDTGSLAGWKIDKTNQTLTSPNGLVVIDAKNEKISINGVELKGYGNGLIVSKGLAVECGTDEFSDGTDGFQIINLSTLSSGNYLRIVDNRVYQSPSSSKRYKEIGKNISELDLEEWYEIQPVWAKYKEGYLDKKDARYGKEYPMFIAENIKEHFPLAVDYNKDGLAENWNERVMIPAMFQMLKSQKNEIQSLKKELAAIKQFLSLEGVS